MAAVAAEQPRAMGNRTLILVATLLATFLTAMESTVVSTAMPTVIVLTVMENHDYVWGQRIFTPVFGFQNTSGFSLSQ